MIKAKEWKALQVPERTRLYKVKHSCDFLVEERQKGGSLDQVILEYRIEADDIGYFAKEYRPVDVQKEGSKVIDITAVMINDV